MGTQHRVARRNHHQHVPGKGALLIFGHRVNNVVINRCRKPADADILVPGDTISLIGTTSSRVPYDQIDNMEVTPEEVDVLLREGHQDSSLSGIHTHIARICRSKTSGSRRQRPVRALDIARHRVSGPCRTRRHRGLHHHYRRKAHDIPSDGRVGHRYGNEKTR